MRCLLVAIRTDKSIAKEVMAQNLLVGAPGAGSRDCHYWKNFLGPGRPGASTAAIQQYFLSTAPKKEEEVVLLVQPAKISRGYVVTVPKESVAAYQRKILQHLDSCSQCM